ncbi:NAD(P)H-dependent glycerol-3-phosphate dehydrogenase [Williamsoniiplasma luminosum]|uniref:Glycerol-3-phosphate dehydrogenase [NAD(P)+] n=1 Tax=Williamsoniiplasma luminosum TaxID=214888 RepID=A0A2K8NUC4_9MOLU|nr:NAD(P)H-dependent glycerol-3-phosphate dehydrogenase [Williamsoniiplasma luminosum]ATZ17442.1 NAD(P)H-dependent glycerol-3-phosphate dehydrogenase [Williamsoniiplasma luminosum]
MKKQITIIGTGAYGTCLANVLADNGHDVVMYGIVEQQVDDLNIYHRNSTFFNDLKFNEKIKATTDLAAALAKTEILILGVPSKALKSVIADILKILNHKVIVINTAKGLEEESLGLLSTLVKKEFAKSELLIAYAAIYGPSIASEVANRKPTGVMLVSDDLKIATDLAPIFRNEYFAVSPWDDLAGCEIGAALKNAIAIGSGIFDGMGIGDNARASLITVGLQEIYEIAKKFGAKMETFLNFAGLGDLILTATSTKSRNYSLGQLIAKENNPQMTIENHKITVEGVNATKVAYNMFVEFNISSEVFKNLYEILFNYKRPIILVNNFLKMKEEKTND